MMRCIGSCHKIDLRGFESADDAKPNQNTAGEAKLKQMKVFVCESNELAHWL